MISIKGYWVYGNGEWEWMFYSFSPLFTCYDKFYESRTEIKNYSNENQILFISEIFINVGNIKIIFYPWEFKCYYI